MPEYELDPAFEQRLERVLRTFADEGVTGYDATETTQTAIHRTRRAPTGLPGHGNAWARPLLLAALLTITLVAVGVVGGLIKLPTDDLAVNPSFVPFSPAPVPTLDASLTPPSGVPPSLVPTLGPGSPDPGATGLPVTPGPGASPTEAASAEPEPSPSPTLEASLEPSPEPTLEPSLEPTAKPEAAIRGLGAGDQHTCALRTDGRVLCFGSNEAGELGDGTTLTRFSADVPVAGLSDAAQVAGGIRFTCALRTTGAVACWGEGGSGQLGNGSTQASPVPVAVSGITDATQIAVGGNHACALLGDRRVMCWGQANRVGNGAPTNSTDAISTPVEVAGIDDAVELAAGWNHTCARRAGGTLACWGLNGDGATGYGGLGDGTLDHASTPVAVTGIDDAAAVAAGGWTTCALRSGGTAWCWGYGERGGLGDGNSSNSATPVQVSGIVGAERIAVGGWHACVLLADGRARCWGANSWGGSAGQLGDGSADDRATPVDVVGVPSMSRLDAGWIHTVALTRDGELWLWGWSADEGGRIPIRVVVSGASFP